MVNSFDKFSSGQNSKKAVFELINERVLDRLDSPDKYDLESFIAKAREIRADDILMKDAQDILLDKHGYGREVDFISIFDDIMTDNNIENYYGAIYNKFGERSYGLVLRGAIGTYIKTSESFTRGGTEVIIFRIVKNDAGVSIVEHSTKILSYAERDGRNVLELKLSDDEIREGWRIGVCKQNNNFFEYYEQALIAVEGSKLFGRFDFDFSRNTIIDRSEQWYEDKTKWQYEWFNGKEVGISIFNPLSITYGGISTFIYSQSDISSQYLKHGIEYDWAKTYFEDLRRTPWFTIVWKNFSAFLFVKYLFIFLLLLVLSSLHFLHITE